jgi:Phage-related protein
VPLHLLQSLDRATNNNIEHQGIDFVTHTIRPWLVRNEQSYNMQLLTEGEKRTYFIEHIVDGLLRGDTESRYKSYNIARMGGWMNADEIRELENMNPMEDGQGKFILHH